MIVKSLIIGFSILFLTALVYFNNSVDTKLAQAPAPTSTSTNTTPCIPTFADGGGPYYLSNSPMREKLVPNEHNGQPLKVRGKLYRNDCKTVIANGIIDIWQADETGEYQNDWYRGRIKTDDQGNYTFETVMPKGYGEGTGYRPPHIHFKIWENEKLLITSQMFFPEVRGTAGFEDAYIAKMEEKTEDGKKVFYATHDIIVP